MDASSRALLDRAKALANGATDSQMLLNAQDNSVDALKRAMNLLNADDDPLLAPLPPMEPLACEAMLAEARGGSSSSKTNVKVPSPVSKPRKARHAPSAPMSDSGTSQRKPPTASTPSLVAAPLARVIELSPTHSSAPRAKGADADLSSAAKAAAERVRQRQQEKTEEAQEQARQEAANKEAFNKASQQKAAKLTADAQERVAKAKREAAMKQEAQQQEQQAAQQQKAQQAMQEEARLAAAAAAGAKRVADRRSREALVVAKARADEEEQKRVAQQKSNAVAEAAAAAAKKRVAVQKRAARQQKQERDAMEAREQNKRQDRIHDALAAQQEARRLDMAEQSARRHQSKQSKQSVQTSAAVPLLPKHTPRQISPQPIRTARSVVSSVGGGGSTARSSSKAPSKSPTRVTQPASKSVRHAQKRQSVHQSFIEEEDAKVVQHDSGDGYAITVDVSATPFRFAAEDAPQTDVHQNSPTSDSSFSPGGSTRIRGVRRVAPWSQQLAPKQPEAAYSPEAAQIERDFVGALNDRSEELYEDEPLEGAPPQQQRPQGLQICTEAAIVQLGGDPSPAQAMRRCSDAVVSSPGRMSSPGSFSDCNLASIMASRRVTSRASRRSYVAELSPCPRSAKQPSSSYHCGIAPPATGSTAASTDTAKELQRRKRRTRQPPWKNRDPIKVAPLEHYRAKLGDIKCAEPSPRGQELEIKSPLVGLLGSRNIERHSGGQRSVSRESRRQLNSRPHALGERKVKSSGDSCMDLLQERSLRVSNKARSRAMEVERQQQQHNSEFYN